MDKTDEVATMEEQEIKKPMQLDGWLFLLLVPAFYIMLHIMLLYYTKNVCFECIREDDNGIRVCVCVITS